MRLDLLHMPLAGHWLTWQEFPLFSSHVGFLDEAGNYFTKIPGKQKKHKIYVYVCRVSVYDTMLSITIIRLNINHHLGKL